MMSEAPYAGALLLLILISGLVDATSPFIFAVQPDNRAVTNTTVLINATVSAQSNWTFNINWSYHVRDCRADLPIALEANRRARLKLIPDNDTNSTYVLAMDDKGNTANATVSLRNDNPVKLMIQTNISALQLLIPELRLGHGNDRVIQIEMSLVNESTQDIHELLKKYENEPALAEHCVRISVNVSDVLNILHNKSNTIHGRLSFIEETVPFEVTSLEDTSPPVITPISPSNSSIFSSHRVPLNLSANEPVRLWLYRLNNGSNVSFPGGDKYANTTITAIEGENTLDVYAMDLAGNTGKASVSFVVVKPRVATESSVQGVGDIHIEKEVSNSDIAIASEELVMGTDGKYSINSIEILSEPMNISSYPDYHYTEKITFTGNTLTLKHKNSASQGKTNITFSEDTRAIELQKQTRINIKTSSENPGLSYDTEANDTFIGHKKTNVELRTSTSKVSIRHLLEGNCSSQLKLSVLE